MELGPPQELLLLAPGHYGLLKEGEFVLHRDEALQLAIQYQMVSPEIKHTQANIKWTQHVAYVSIYTYMQK